jgi:hypothetical protein
MSMQKVFPKFKILIPLLGAFVLLFIYSGPAHANAPITWGIESAIAPIKLASATRGISAIAIILIESWILYYFLKSRPLIIIMTVLTMNIVSAGVGIFASPLIFMGSFVLIALVIVPIIIYKALQAKSAPAWFIWLSIATFCIGTIASLDSNIIQWIGNPLRLLLVIDLPLLYGFGISLASEGVVAAMILKQKGIWKSLALANLGSYILLFCLYPAFAPNPISTYYLLDFQLRQRIRENQTEQVLDILHLRNASTLSLLGLADENPPPENYSADFEIDLLTNYSPKITDTSLVVVEDTLKIQTLTPIARAKLEWLRNFFTFRLDTEDSIKNNDQPRFNEIYSAWVEWNSVNPFPESDDNHAPDMHSWLTNPELIITNLISDIETTVEIPASPDNLEKR